MNRHFSTWRTRILSLFRLVLLISGCVATLKSPAWAATWSTTDLKSNMPLPYGKTTVNSVTVAWQVGNYLSDGLQIYGLLCTPISLPPPYPVAILNHGLAPVGSPPTYPAIEPNGFTGCTQMAGNGWLTAITTYRGEFIDALPPYTNVRFTSEGLSLFFLTGWLELWLGEVDDVLSLLSEVTAMPDANANQVFMWGHSHGSCITERAIERGAAVKVAVSLDGPTDLTTWVTQPPLHLSTIEKERRSSALNNPATLGNVKFLRIQARGDEFVTPDQACELASKLSGSVNYYLYADATPPGVYENASPPQCTNFSLSWVNQWVHGKNSPPPWVLPDEAYGQNQPYPAPGPWPQTVLLMCGNVKQLPPNQVYHTWILEKTWPEYSSFVNAVATSGGWSASIPSTFIPFE